MKQPILFTCVNQECQELLATTTSQGKPRELFLKFSNGMKHSKHFDLKHQASLTLSIGFYQFTYFITRSR